MNALKTPAVTSVFFRMARGGLAVAVAALCLAGARESWAQTFSVGTILVDASRIKGNETDPAIAINPLNRNNLFIAAAEDGKAPGLFVGISSNLGASWATSIIATNKDTQGLPPAYGLPSVAWDVYGNLFVAYLPASFEGVAVAVSTNGGKTFATVTNLAALDATDQPRITTPAGGAGAGTVWVVYKDYTLPGTPLVAQGLASTGLGTNGRFGPVEMVPDSADGGFADIAAGPAGQVMVAFQNNINSPDQSAIFVTVNTNEVTTNGMGTNDFPAPVAVVSDAIGGSTYVGAEQTGIGINAGAGLGWDSYEYGINYGTAYLVYTAVGSNGFLVINMCHSTDGGVTWSPETAVDDDAASGSADHFYPRMAVDPSTGIIGCVWYDCRNDQGGGSKKIVVTTNSTLTLKNLMVTNIVQNTNYPTSNLSIGYTWTDLTGGGTNLQIELFGNDINGILVTNDKANNIYLYGGKVTNFALSVEGSSTNFTDTIQVFVTNTYPDIYTGGSSSDEEPIVYGTMSLDGGNTFLANQPLINFNQTPNPPAIGFASLEAGSASLTGWGHYTGLAAYGGVFYPAWADNSDLTTNNPDGDLTNFDIYTLSGGIVVPTADLSVWVTNSPNPVVSEGVLIYTLVASNHGPSQATGVVVTDTLANNVTLESVVPAHGITYINNVTNIVFNIPSLLLGQVLTNTIRVTATSSAFATNVATVYSPLTDLNPLNNTNRLVLLIAGEELALGMATSETNVLIGDRVSNYITVINNGPSANAPAIVTNTYSTNWGDFSVQTPGTYFVTNDTVVINLGLLPTNQPVTSVVTATALSVGTYASNAATVWSLDVDTNLANNSATNIYYVNDEVLGISMASPARVNLGEPFTYTVTVGDLGLSYTGDVMVTNMISGNIELLGASESQGSSIVTNNEVLYNAGIIPAGQTATLTVLAVAQSWPAWATNVAMTGSTDFDLNPTNTATTNTIGINDEDLAIGIVSPPSVNLGQPSIYTVSVTNLGPSTNGIITVVLDYSTNLGQINVSQSQGTNVAGIDGWFTLGTLNVGQVATLSVCATALSQPASATVFASVSSSDFDTNQANNTALDTVTVNGEDLAIGIASPASVNLGVPFNYTISVTNLGLSTNGIVTVQTLLSTNLGQFTVSQSQGTNTVTGNEIMFDLGTLAAGEVATLDISAVALSGPPSATVFASVSSQDFDTNLANNATLETVTVNGEDLGISITPSLSILQVGQTVTNTEVVTNAGPSTNGIVLVTNTLSASLGQIAVLQPANNYSINGNEVVFNLGTLAGGQSELIVVSAVAEATGSGTEKVSVFSADFDTNAANNTAQAVVSIIAALPMISNVVVTPLASSAFISWRTGALATGQVQYGLTSAEGGYSSVSTVESSNHVALLTGLARGANYYYTILSWVGGKLYTTNGTFATTDTLILNTPDASYSGLWTASTVGSGIYGNYYQSANSTNGNATAWAVFAPYIPAAGNYDVSIWHPQGTNYTTNAQVYISGATNEVMLRINQTTNGGRWQPLASNMYFANGTGGNVTIYNDTGETGKSVVANAMRWDYDTGQDNPTNSAVPAWWANFYFGTNAYANPSAGGSVDADGDGYSNYAEYVFGTDPTDPASHVNFSINYLASNEVAVVFSPWQGGRSYQLQCSTNPQVSGWTALTNTVTVDTNGEGVFTVTEPNGSSAFYRLSAQILPQ